MSKGFLEAWGSCAGFHSFAHAVCMSCHVYVNVCCVVSSLRHCWQRQCADDLSWGHDSNKVHLGMYVPYPRCKRLALLLRAAAHAIAAGFPREVARS